MIKAFLLAAGVGSRLRPLTDHLPKCLLPLSGRPVLDYWLALLAQAKCVEARVNTHACADRMRAFLELPKPTDYPRLSEFYEPELLGSAGTLAANSEFADDASEVIIIYADQLSDVDLAQMLAYHRSSTEPITMLLYRTANPKSCGIVELDSDNRCVAFEEKPQYPNGNLANGGIYILSPEAYREMAALNAFDLAFDVLPRFVGRMRGWVFNGYHRDIGTHESLARAREDVAAVVSTVAARVEPRPAVFFDRDGTLIEPFHYLSDPARVRLVDHAAIALRQLHCAGYKLVLVTNQSGIGRGLITLEQYQAVQSAMQQQLFDEGAWLDATYFCPTVPSIMARDVIEDLDRKPGPGMLQRAARELNLDLSRSWMIGDMVSDVLAGANAGCHGSVLIETGGSAETNGIDAIDCHRVTSLAEAAHFVLSHSNERVSQSAENVA